ncbi:MAG: hypothetical protein F6J87_20275 [Spirulina sp. SIO3F2]|nr:hypothetical protein [Spirulina sp. SIO3F2]
MSTCYEFAFECQIKCDVSKAVIDTLKYMTRSQEYDFETPDLHHALFKEELPWKQTIELLGRKVTVIQYEWRTILTNYPCEGEQYLPGEFYSIFKNNQLNCRRLSGDDTFNNVWWLLFPWLASISESVGFVGYYRNDFDDYPTLIQFLDGKSNIYEMMLKGESQAGLSESNDPDKMFNLDIDALSNVVRDELVRQAENFSMSLESYILSTTIKEYVNSDVLMNLDI